ncbi:putative chitin biosynthesis protein [Scheffersomyces amazonensis]|uniref:putative chitin biosynthesis protein n=1 Tax=Scheffersomyces amazonensis TaxID=1078765 RepID=UPI00315DA51D
MVEVSLTVGKLDASLALLLTKDHHLIEFPTILLPNGVKAGSIVKIKCDQDLDTEREESIKFQSIQDEILSKYGSQLPKAPVLKIKNVTQTSCVLEWDTLDLGTASLKNLILFKDDKKLGAIPQALSNKTTKLSGLPIDKAFKFQLRLDTTAGTFTSNIIEVTTHKMTDLSGISVCLGDISPNQQFTTQDIEDTLTNIGANPIHEKVRVETTHFLCTKENKQNPEYIKASEMNIPIIRPEWLKACERERRIVGVRDFYVKDCVLPDIFAKNYWGKSDSAVVSPPEEEPQEQTTETNNSETQEDVSTPVVEASEDLDVPEIRVEPSTPLQDIAIEETVEVVPTVVDDLPKVKDNDEVKDVSDESVPSVQDEIIPPPVPEKDVVEPVEPAPEPVTEPVTEPVEAVVEEPKEEPTTDAVEEPATTQDEPPQVPDKEEIHAEPVLEEPTGDLAEKADTNNDEGDEDEEAEVEGEDGEEEVEATPEPEGTASTSTPSSKKSKKKKSKKKGKK